LLPGGVLGARYGGYQKTDESRRRARRSCCRRARYFRRPAWLDMNRLDMNRSLKMNKSITLILLIPVIALLGACNGSSSGSSAASEPVIPFMAQPDPAASLPPCVLDGTVGLDYEQGDDTTYADTGPHRGNGFSAGDQTSAPADLP